MTVFFSLESPRLMLGSPQIYNVVASVNQRSSGNAYILSFTALAFPGTFGLQYKNYINDIFYHRNLQILSLFLLIVLGY